jgi:hypothetical protein
MLVPSQRQDHIHADFQFSRRHRLEIRIFHKFSSPFNKLRVTASTFMKPSFLTYGKIGRKWESYDDTLM